jgi:hypothetical protein
MIFKIIMVSYTLPKTGDSAGKVFFYGEVLERPKRTAC